MNLNHTTFMNRCMIQTNYQHHVTVKLYALNFIVKVRNVEIIS